MATTFESKGLAEHAESNGLVKHADNNGLVDNTTSEGNTVTIINTSWRRMVYRIGDNPPLKLLLLFTLQQGLLAISNSLIVSSIVSDVVCARDDEEFKTQILSATFLMVGLSTFFMSTVGVRLPIFQGPANEYIIPLLTLSAQPEWKCPSQEELVEYYANTTTNLTDLGKVLPMPKEFIYHHVQRMSGSLMAAGAVHFLIAVTGLAGCLLRFIGPVTIVPAITLVGLYIFKVVVRFSETFWGVAVLTAATGIILSLYLAKRSTPIPFWSRSKGFHIIWYPLHQVFALLIAMMVGWGVSAILTTADVLSSDRNNVQFYARTDTRSHVITNSPWFSFPYPGRFGAPSFDTGIFIGFLLATLMSILDSIGDYSACARTCYVPQPPNWALNRGLAVEGFMSFISGALGIGHATSSFGGNIGAMGLTRVASRRVFQGVGIMYVFFSIFNKFGAVFVTIPYSVLGGCQIVTIGLFIGIVLSNLQYIDLRSTRNVAIIGISLLVGLMIPHWMEKTPNGIRTGSIDLDRTIGILLTNPVFVGGFLACFLDNTVPGTLEERGLSKHSSKEELSKGPADDHFEEGLEVYDIPYVQKYMEKSRITKVCRIFPGGSSTSSSTSSDTTRDEEERLGCLKDGDTAGLHSTNM